MSGARFVRARQVGSAVIYSSEDGREIKYSGGDWAWRNNNPGNLRPGNVSKRNGAIGIAGGFAVFADYETGHKALLDSLITVHGHQNIDALMEDYAPSKENNTALYIKFLRKMTGIKDDRKVREFTPSEFEKLWRNIERMEGQKKGKIEEVGSDGSPKDKKQILKVNKYKKGTIVSYYVEEIGWISKQDCIDLVANGDVDAVVATSRSGRLYLRTRPGIEIVNLEDLG